MWEDYNTIFTNTRTFFYKQCIVGKLNLTSPCPINSCEPCSTKVLVQSPQDKPLHTFPSYENIVMMPSSWMSWLFSKLKIEIAGVKNFSCKVLVTCWLTGQIQWCQCRPTKLKKCSGRVEQTVRIDYEVKCRTGGMKNYSGLYLELNKKPLHQSQRQV